MKINGWIIGFYLGTIGMGILITIDLTSAHPSPWWAFAFPIWIMWQFISGIKEEYNKIDSENDNE